jgi:hypothetical protein
MLEFQVNRRFLKDTYTISDVNYKLNDGDWIWLCNGMEPPVGRLGVNGYTAIPTGQYQFIITMSPKFGFDVPLLLDVPGRTEIEWHPGDFPYDTEGCLCVGINNIVGRLTNSDITFNKLMNLLKYNPQPQYSVMYTQTNG